MSDQCSLTQADLEEYNNRSYYDQPVFHHQKQSSYAQSEGYHSYVSSSDSSSATPFLDRLRQESELLSRHMHHNSQNDISSSSNNSTNPGENNSSESTSSTETLKWLGSMSDVSVASHASSAISGSVSSSQLIVHSSKVQTPKRHNSESVLYMNEDQLDVTNDVNTIKQLVSDNKAQLIFPQHSHYHHSTPTVNRTTDHQNSSRSPGILQSTPSFSAANSNVVTAAPSTSSSSSYRNNYRLFPISTYSEPINGNNTCHTPTQLQYHQEQQSAQPQTQQHSQQLQASVGSSQISSMKLPSPQSGNWQSVAERINDFERHQQHLSAHHYHGLPQQSNSAQKYSYIDPSKTHRVPNPALKAFQKNAVQSYFERQQQNAKENKNYLSNGSTSRPPSIQPLSTPKDSPIPQVRTSLSSNYIVSPVNQRNLRAQQLSNNSPIPTQANSTETSFSDCNTPPPPPPPRSRSLIRRSSSASDYADLRANFVRTKERQSIMKEKQSSTIISAEKSAYNSCGMPPPPPPPRGRISLPIRRTSSASEYVGIRDKINKSKQNLSQDLLGPIIMGPIISVDDWVPERPPKNPQLRVPSPDLPPPPIQVNDGDIHYINQDEPLPPPPPELLRHIRPISDSDIKQLSSNRRNSFTESSNRKTLYKTSTYETASVPSIPRKPASLEIMQCRTTPSLTQSNKAHKVILNGKLEEYGAISDHPVTQFHMQDHALIPKNTDSRIRKRAHNSGMPPSSPLLDSINKSTSENKQFNLKSPPSLKPRVPISGQDSLAASSVINNKLRCNSKTSYLPRNSRDRLNSTDPDHGSYKLTITSNEDNIDQNSPAGYQSDVLSGKCNNLPDVLPVGIKMQTSSPGSSESSPRYSYSSNVALINTPHTAPAIISNYPKKSVFHFQCPLSSNNKNNNNCSNPSLKPSSSPLFHSTAQRASPLKTIDSISPKFMSQSTIDLKDGNVESNDNASGKILSPAQSENNISCHDKPPISPLLGKREIQRTDVVKKLSLEERDPSEGRIVRAELVNTTLSTSPTRSEEKIMIRKDNLRDNIEKITQLQSKLMTAHLVDTGTERKLLGFTTRTVEVKAQQHMITDKESLKPEESNALKSVKRVQPITNSYCSTLSTPVLGSPPSAKDEPILQMDTELDGLKLMQRTEIVVRLNAPTIEAASQTDETLESELSRVKLTDSKDDVNKNSMQKSSTLLPRRKLLEEIDCDNLTQDLVNCLPPNDKLCQLLAPKIFKVSSDYVSGLYNENVSTGGVDVGLSTLNDKSVGCELIKPSNVEVLKFHSAASGGIFNQKTSHNDRIDSCDLTKKKEELINRLTKTLEMLGSEQNTILEENIENEKLSSDLAAKILEKGRPSDASKFRAYIDDVGHITLLLLSLSGRLAKTENVLYAISDNHTEKKNWEMKRNRLLEQLEEAKRLKEDIDRRGTVMKKILQAYLTNEEYMDYEYFINMKAKLIVDSREIADRIKLNEEHLNALKDTT